MSIIVGTQVQPIVVEEEGKVVVAGESGPQGPPGLTWRGAYAAGTTYAEDDVVSSGGSAWVSLAAANTGHDPASSPTWWSLLASKGDTGEQGEQGIQGDPGVDGETHLFVGDVEPDNDLGVPGDLYIQAAEVIYLKVPNSPPPSHELEHWVAVGSMLGEQGETGPAGADGSTPLTLSGEEPGALVDGTLATMLCPQTGSLTAAGGLLTTGPTGTMTLALMRGVDALITWTWAPAAVMPSHDISGPIAVTAGDSLSLVLAGSAGAVGLTYYATGTVS